MPVKAVSKRELQAWVSDTTGEQCSNLNKDCASGVLPITLLNTLHPNAVDARKMKSIDEQAQAARAAVAGQRSFFGGGADVPSDPKDLVLARPLLLRTSRPLRLPHVGAL